MGGTGGEDPVKAGEGGAAGEGVRWVGGVVEGAVEGPASGLDGVGKGVEAVKVERLV